MDQYMNQMEQSLQPGAESAPPVAPIPLTPEAKQGKDSEPVKNFLRALNVIATPPEQKGGRVPIRIKRNNFVSPKDEDSPPSPGGSRPSSQLQLKEKEKEDENSVWNRLHRQKTAAHVAKKEKEPEPWSMGPERDVFGTQRKSDGGNSHRRSNSFQRQKSADSADLTGPRLLLQNSAPEPGLSRTPTNQSVPPSPPRAKTDQKSVFDRLTDASHYTGIAKNLHKDKAFKPKPKGRKKGANESDVASDEESAAPSSDLGEKDKENFSQSSEKDESQSGKGAKEESTRRVRGLSALEKELEELSSTFNADNEARKRGANRSRDGNNSGFSTPRSNMNSADIIMSSPINKESAAVAVKTLDNLFERKKKHQQADSSGTSTPVSANPSTESSESFKAQLAQRLGSFEPGNASPPPKAAEVLKAFEVLASQINKTN